MVQKADRIDPKSEVFGNTANEKMIQITLQRSCTQVHIPYRTISEPFHALLIRILRTLFLPKI